MSCIKRSNEFLSSCRTSYREGVVWANRQRGQRRLLLGGGEVEISKARGLPWLARPLATGRFFGKRAEVEGEEEESGEEDWDAAVLAGLLSVAGAPHFLACLFMFDRTPKRR